MKAKWLVSPRLNSWQKSLVAQLKKRCPGDPQLIWILSSGTQSVDQVKAIGLTRHALENSARAVNQALEAKPSDRWLVALPEYHIGGYAISVRARLSRSRVFRLPQWNIKSFVRSLSVNKITLCSLVPTQLHDLVKAKIVCPKHLRALIIGGGALDSELYFEARQLGWPILPSYGLSECASQVATADLKSLNKKSFPPLKVLSHAKIKISDDRLLIQSSAACSLVATMNRAGEFTLEDPLRKGWLPTEDLGELKNGGLHPLGRRDELIKVLGTLVSLPQIEHELRKLAANLSGDLGVIAFRAPRSGAVLALVTDSLDSLQAWEELLGKYNQSFRGPSRIVHLCWLPQLPRTSLGKLKRAELRHLILNEGSRELGTSKKSID